MLEHLNADSISHWVKATTNECKLDGEEHQLPCTAMNAVELKEYAVWRWLTGAEGAGGNQGGGACGVCLWHQM